MWAVVALTLMMAPLAGAQGDVPPQTVWTVFTTVEATVEDNYARVDVIADIGNEGPDPEFPFQVTIPDDAFVTGLVIERDGERFEATIEERAAARETYEDVKDREATGGLVERQRGSSTYSFLVNVAEFTSVRATLSYEHLLVAHEGTFELPLAAPVSGFGRDLGARFDVTISNSDGVDAAWGSAGNSETLAGGATRLTYQVGPRPDDASTPFAASYQLPATGDEGSILTTVEGGLGYLAHRFRAPADADDLPLDLVLALDTSGSMRGQKIAQVQDAARQLVARLDGDDRLALVFFASDASSAWTGWRQADADTRTLALDALDDAEAMGGTNMGAALEQGAGLLATSSDSQRVPMVVLLSDGKPTAGETDHGDLRAIAANIADAGGAVHTLAFGHDADWGLAAGLARDGGGTATRIDEGAGAEVDLGRFLTALATPVLTDLKVHYEETVDVADRFAPVLLAGSELLFVGTFDAQMDRLRGNVTATGPDGLRVYPFDVAVDENGPTFLPRLVAYQQIRALQDEIAAQGELQELVDQVLELSLEHGFVTDYTSLVIALPDADPRPWDDDVAAEGGDSSADAASSGSWPPRSGSGGNTGGDGHMAYDTGGSTTGDTGSRGGGDGAQVAGGEGADDEGTEQPLPVVLLVAALAFAAVAARRRRA